MLINKNNIEGIFMSSVKKEKADSSEEIAANLVGFTVEEFRNIKKVIGNGIPELIEATRKKIITIIEAGKIAELSKKDQLFELSLIIEKNK